MRISMKRNRRQRLKTSTVRVATVGGAVLVCFLVILLASENALLQTIYNPATSQTYYNVTHLNMKYETVEDILDWVCSSVDRLKIVSMTNWGPSSLVILHMLEQKENCIIPVVTIDTLHLFPESYEFIESKQAALGRHFSVYKPKSYPTKEAFDLHFGEDFYQRDPKQYAYWSKIEPTYRALRELGADAWITGRRRSQAGERSTLQAFELDTASKQKTRLKINPLLYWTYDQVWEYIRTNNISYNPLYDQNYKSLGDVQTTRTVAPDEDERSGRFQGLNQSECGIHNLEMLSQADVDDLEGEAVNNNFLELDRVTLASVVLQESNEMRDGKDSIFIVFYHPQCSHCRHFEPTFFEIAERIKNAPYNSPLQNIVVARYNIGRHRLPKTAIERGLIVPGTPALYFIQHKPVYRVAKREGLKQVKPLLDWLEEEYAFRNDTTT
eukprot:scaffold2744_cov136-Cylindrotheca_fusiformis.AAC.5